MESACLFKMAATEHKQIKSSKKQPKSDQKNKSNSIEPTLFNLKEVISLGGNKEDYQRLLNINDEDDEEIFEDNTEDNDIENLQNEIGSLIKELGFDEEIKSENLEENNNINDNDLKKKNFNDEKSNKKEKKMLSKVSKEKTELDVKKVLKKEVIDFDVEGILSKVPLASYNKYLLKECVPWHNQLSAVPKKTSELESKQIDLIREKIEEYWNKEVELYQEVKKKDKSSDAQWLSTVLKSGTLSDKTAALTMLTQESPVHCTRSLDALMSLAKKKGRREALVAVDSLRHLWVSDLLPEVKLRKLHEYPIEEITLFSEGPKSQIQLLILMIYEEKLKDVYKDFLEIITTLSKDPLVNIRNKILGIVFELLVLKPEGEQTLLGILINKLGDPEKTVASKASYLLLQLVMKHPNMKTIVITEVERMMFRPNVGLKAQYYACCFLNQIPLSHSIKATASKLVSLYFSFFKILVNKQSQSTDIQITKLLSALLTGVNRAFPYTGGEEKAYEEQLNTLFKLAHNKHLGTSVQAFMLIYHVMESKQTVSDRFYQALYEKLLDPELKTSSKQTMLLNLIFKAVRDDPTLKRVKAFVKRLLQISSQSQPTFQCGVLFLLSEIIKKKQGLKSMIEQPEDDEDEDEHFTDIVLDEDEENPNKERNEENNENVQSEENKNGPSWTFRNKNKNQETYSINSRNPLYAGAEFSCAWELASISTHFHPSAQHFADSLLKGEDIVYKGDPLDDFTLLRFLDRFMYRNPKKHDVEHGNSLMQKQKHSARLKEQPVNSNQFLQHSEETVRQDELFFLRYFKMKDEDSSKKKVKEEDDEEKDIEDESIDAFGDMDFASEMKKNKSGGKETGNKNQEEDDDESGSEDGEFDYNDMMEEESDFDENEAEGKKNFSDKDYEQALFSQLNSDGESMDEGDEDDVPSFDRAPMNSMKSKKRRRDGSMFASAEEFAHLLEGGEENSGDYAESVHPKQRKWEESQQQSANKVWNKKRKHFNSGGGKKPNNKHFKKN